MSRVHPWLNVKKLDAAHGKIFIDCTVGEYLQAYLLDINPAGQIASLVDGEMVFTETAEICAYFSDKYLGRNSLQQLFIH